MSKHQIRALRTIRKASHLSGKAATKTARLLDRVENKTSRIINAKSGSQQDINSVDVDDLFYSRFPQLIPIHPGLPNVGQKASITVFVPSLSQRGFYGGIATLLIASASLANKLDLDYRVVQTSGFEKNEAVLDFLKENGIIIAPERFSTLDVSFRTPYNFAYLPIHPGDVVVVSAWWDAYNASKLPLGKKFVYMIQDHEPIFYSNSDEKVLAESTYHTDDFIPLCNTELLYDFFVANKYKYVTENAVWFEPAVAKPVSQKKRLASKKKLFLYGRPNVDRNLFYGAIKALDLALLDDALNGIEFEIYSAGQSDLPTLKLHSGTYIENLGKMSYADYYDFAQSVDVAISPMLAPHPNYPTLELASIGAMVVTTKYETKQNLDRYCANIIMSDPDIVSLSKSIVKAVLTDESKRFANVKASRILKGWPDAVEPAISKIEKILS